MLFVIFLPFPLFPPSPRSSEFSLRTLQQLICALPQTLDVRAVVLRARGSNVNPGALAGAAGQPAAAGAAARAANGASDGNGDGALSGELGLAFDERVDYVLEWLPQPLDGAAASTVAGPSAAASTGVVGSGAAGMAGEGSTAVGSASAGSAAQTRSPFTPSRSARASAGPGAGHSQSPTDKRSASTAEPAPVAWSQRDLVLNSAQGARRRAYAHARLLQLAAEARRAEEAAAARGGGGGASVSPPLAPLPVPRGRAAAAGASGEARAAGSAHESTSAVLGGAGGGALSSHGSQRSAVAGGARSEAPRRALDAAARARAQIGGAAVSSDQSPAAPAAVAAVGAAIAPGGGVPGLAADLPSGLAGLSAGLIEGVRQRQAAREARAAAQEANAEINILKALPEVALAVRGCLRAAGNRRALPLLQICQRIAESPLSRRAAHELEPLVRRLATVAPTWCAVRPAAALPGSRANAPSGPDLFVELDATMAPRAINALLAAALREAEAAVLVE